MNERIKLLARQAGFETNETNFPYGNYKVDQEYFYAEDFIEDELKKFAELIVKECWTSISPFIEDDKLAEDALAELKEQFGVEE